MKVRWLEDAFSDLQSLRSYIEQDNPKAAAEVMKKIVNSIDFLSENPGIGGKGRVLHTRELIIANTPYIVPYRVKNSVIEILRVFYCAMQWPESL